MKKQVYKYRLRVGRDMKRVTLAKFKKNVELCLLIAQAHRVLVMRRGQPLALITGVEGRDEDSVLLGSDPALLAQLRRARRAPRPVPFEEARRRLGITEEQLREAQAVSRRRALRRRRRPA